MDPVTLALTAISSLIPVGVHGVKAAIDHFWGSSQVKPATVDEEVKLEQAATARLQTLYSLGQGQPSYRWVTAIVQLERPLLIAGVLAAWLWVHLHGGVDPQQVDHMAASVGGFLLGDRTLFMLRGGGK